MSRGRFITFEGGEGSGKSTHVKRLAQGLAAAGIDVLTTREPGGTPGAEAIRSLLLEGEAGRWDPTAEALLHYAARRDHVSRVIRPALDAGRWVISDRFADSSMAYQGFGLGLGREALETLQGLALGDFQPDLTVVLDLPVETGLDRAGGQGHGADRYQRLSVEFHRRVRQGFLEIAAREPERCVVIDAAGVVEATEMAVRAALRERLGVEAS